MPWGTFTPSCWARCATAVDVPTACLADKMAWPRAKAAEDEDLAHHHRHGTEHEDLGGEHERAAGHGRERGADRSCAVLGAHDQDTQDPEDELAEEDTDQAPAGWIVDDVGGAHRAGAQCAQSPRRPHPWRRASTSSSGPTTAWSTRPPWPRADRRGPAAAQSRRGSEPRAPQSRSTSELDGLVSQLHEGVLQ